MLPESANEELNTSNKKGAVMFCAECGTRIDDRSIVFCPECGTRVEWEESVAAEVADAVGVKPEEAEVREEVCNREPEVAEAGEAVCDREPVVAEAGGKAGDEDIFAYGILFTNVAALAKRLGVDEGKLRSLLEDFISKKRDCGVSYKLVDAGNYSFKKSGLFGGTRTVHLNRESALWDYMEILLDVHNREVKKGEPESQYLFIVGGDDVIPMPCVRHYIQSEKSKDNTIDTDMLYAYPYGKQMIPLLENQEIFKYDQLFYVGRLPFGEDASIEDMFDYLQRNISSCGVVPMTEAYGQCDPHWQRVSSAVSSKFVREGYYRDYSRQLSGDYYYKGLIVSPMVVYDNVNQVFNDEASFYYFNLHGSDAKGNAGYFGVMLNKEEKGGLPVIGPAHMYSCKSANVVISEACYGGRFIGFDKAHSMVLASIYGNSLAFVGSSRIAWGAVDGGSDSVHISSADIVAKTFIEAATGGCTVGEAFFAARAAVLKNSTPGDLHAALTVVEFNLYGDPTVFVYEDSDNKAVGGKFECDKSVIVEQVMENRKEVVIDREPLVDKDVDLRCEVEEVKLDSGRSASILEQVRGAVNANIMQIHDTMARHLYSNYGITPRPASVVLKISYANGQKELMFDYDLSDERNMPTHYVVKAEMDGKVKGVYATK